MPVPRIGRQYPRLVVLEAGREEEAAMGKRQPVLQADLTRGGGRERFA